MTFGGGQGKDTGRMERNLLQVGSGEESVGTESADP